MYCMYRRVASTSFFIGKGGGDLISFGSGQPDLPPPRSIYKVLKTFNGFRYGLIQGEENLREALSREYPGAQRDHFVITNGASEALDLVLRALMRPGAKILLPKPYYYSYLPIARMAGMKPVFYVLKEGKIDFDEFARKIRDCVAVLINSPSNPTGTVQEIAVLKKIEKLANRLGVYVISDEVYKDLIYVRKNYLIEGSRVLTINSFSKTYAMCGLRVGYLYSKNREIVEKVIEMKTHTSMNTNIIGQAMALEATKIPKDIIRRQTRVWEERRDLIYHGMRNLGLELWKPEGAFYVFPKFKNPPRVVADLYYKYKVITYDGTWFGDPHRVRFSYALDKNKIKEGLGRLKLFLSREYKKY